jgi:hypothetical protein
MHGIAVDRLVGLKHTSASAVSPCTKIATVAHAGMNQRLPSASALFDEPDARTVSPRGRLEVATVNWLQRARRWTLWSERTAHRLRALAAAMALALAPGLAGAGLTVAHSGDPSFHARVVAALAALEKSEDAAIRQLHAAVRAAPSSITIRQITDDSATWHRDGDPDRGHTDPADGKPKSRGRTTPTAAIVFIPASAVDPRKARWHGGLFVHELVHALDLAYGRYHRDYTVRERRAVFLQNVWRARLGFSLRTSYHGRFATLDYQDAARRGSLERYARYVFTRADFPPPA